MADRRRGARGGRALVVALILVAACTDDDASPSTTSPGTTAPTAPPTSPGPSEPSTPTIDRRDRRPLITLTYVPYASPAYNAPADLADLYVYPDGVVVEIRYDNRARELERTRRRISDRRLTGLVALAQVAGLVGGGTQRRVAAPALIEDGGGTRLTLREGDIVTGRQLDHLNRASDEDGPIRLAFGALSDDLRRLLGGRQKAAAVERWVVVSEPLPTGGRTVKGGTWRGVRLADLSWTNLGDGVRCAIVDRRHWRVSKSVPMYLAIERRLVSRRPLLRHERACADVGEWRDALGLNSAVDIPTNPLPPDD